MYAYQESGRFFAQVPDGGEEIAAADLAALGATSIEAGYRGLYFSAAPEALYRIAYSTLTITRVLAPLVTFQCHSPEYLYKRVHEIPWTEMFNTRHTLAVFATVSNSAIRHSQYAALTVKDAVVDLFREKTGERPNVDTTAPDVWINLYLHANRATVSLDVSGGSMHRRGYRVESVEAPMQETVAAVLVAMTGWDGSTPLVDPMCGSGTILAEAVMRYCRVPSGYLRRGFGFEFLPDFDAAMWDRVKRETDAAIRQLPDGLVRGSDAAPEAVRATSANLARIPGGDSVRIARKRFEAIDRIAGHTIVCNPPYGLRIGRRDAMPDFIRGFGDFLKQRCAGCTAFVYFGNRELIKAIGLRTTWKKPLANGGLDGRLVRLDLFEGTRRDAEPPLANSPDS
jgi:23S rRNA (guanine2445-N2)-methyltransferase